MWSPDGARIAFERERSGQVSIRQSLVNGTAGDEPLLEGSTSKGDLLLNAVPSDWSADGRFIAYTQRSSSNTSDLWVLPLFGDRKPIPVLQTSFVEQSAVFSADGRWIAYTTTEPGQPNIYVQRFPGPGGKYQVSRDGGSHPVWRSDGKELFYLGPDTTPMVASVEGTDRLDIGVPRRSSTPSGPMPSFPPSCRA